MLKIDTYSLLEYSDLIERIWILENDGEDLDLMIPPNPYVNMVFPIGESRYMFIKEWIGSPQIEGISLQTISLHYPAKTKFIGIRFFPYGWFSFLKLHGSEILNKSLNLNPLTPNLSIGAFENKEMINEDILEEIYRILNQLYIENQDQNLDIVKEFYEQFRNGESQESIEEFCHKHHSNYSTLNRYFSKVTGLSPKRFERLIKFRKSLCSLIDNPQELTKIGLDSGYFDQAHFIREFKLFLNHTPSSYQSLIHSADKESKIVNYNFRIF